MLLLSLLLSGEHGGAAAHARWPHGWHEYPWRWAATDLAHDLAAYTEAGLALPAAAGGRLCGALAPAVLAVLATVRLVLGLLSGAFMCLIGVMGLSFALHAVGVEIVRR